MMSCMVNPTVTAEVTMSVEFNFTDTNSLLRLEMRNGVCQVQKVLTFFCLIDFVNRQYALRESRHQHLNV